MKFWDFIRTYFNKSFMDSIEPRIFRKVVYEEIKEQCPNYYWNSLFISDVYQFIYNLEHAHIIGSESVGEWEYLPDSIIKTDGKKIETIIKLSNDLRYLIKYFNESFERNKILFTNEEKTVRFKNIKKIDIKWENFVSTFNTKFNNIDGTKVNKMMVAINKYMPVYNGPDSYAIKKYFGDGSSLVLVSPKIHNEKNLEFLINKYVQRDNLEYNFKGVLLDLVYIPKFSINYKYTIDKPQNDKIYKDILDISPPKTIKTISVETQMIISCDSNLSMISGTPPATELKESTNIYIFNHPFIYALYSKKNRLLGWGVIKNL